MIVASVRAPKYQGEKLFQSSTVVMYTIIHHKLSIHQAQIFNQPKRAKCQSKIGRLGKRDVRPPLSPSGRIE